MSRENSYKTSDNDDKIEHSSYNFCQIGMKLTATRFLPVLLSFHLMTTSRTTWLTMTPSTIRCLEDSATSAKLPKNSLPYLSYQNCLATSMFPSMQLLSSHLTTLLYLMICHPLTSPQDMSTTKESNERTIRGDGYPISIM